VRWIHVALAVTLASAVLLACDSGPDVTPVSTFPDPTPASREIFGHVRAGTEPVAGALVRVDASPGFPVDPQVLATAATDPRFAQTMTTEPSGDFRFQFAPLVYDLSVAHGRDLYVFRELEDRVFDPTLAVEAPVTGFKARLLPSTNPPPRTGNATVYLVSGADARALDPVANAPGALDATFRQFASTITLHAIEYVAASGPSAAVAEGKIDVAVTNGAIVMPIIPMTPVTLMGNATFAATPPPGYALDPLEMEMDLGVRTSSVPLPLTHIVLGQVLHFGVATDVRYFVHARARRGGAVSDSGRFRVNPFDHNTLVQPPPVSTEAPIDDSAPPIGEGTTQSPPVLAVGGTLSVRISAGIVEHALVPQRGTGTTFHVLTGDRTATLPDATAFGLPAPRGIYAWTVQSFPTVPFTERLDGEDGRVMPPSWTSAPQAIVIP
jgi:hypothetical protein